MTTDTQPAPTPHKMTLTDVRTICEPNGMYYGRPSLQILADGTWVMVYIRSKHHWKDPQGQIEVMFSSDEGRTWSEQNTCLDGTPVQGLPSRPAPVGSPYDPVEPYVYLAPSGELIATAMKVDLSGLGKGEPLSCDGCAWITVSADNGRTWDAWRKAVFENLPEGQSADHMDMTQDSFVDGRTIYAASRMADRDRREGSFHKAIAGLFKSPDNGRTWQFVNHIDPDVNWDRTLDCETGIEQVGPTEIVAVTRGTLQGCALPWLTRSHDMGRTWSPLVQADEKVLSWKRPRIYTMKHLRHMSGAEDIPEWWDDDVLLGTGVIQVSQPPSVRNVGLWMSTDKGASWGAPLPLDVDTDDAGYGDLRMRKNGEVVVVSYHGSHEQAAVKQYVVRLETDR
ncbi:sialidase family protein [Verrucomicrobiota bacterium]